MSIRVAVNKSAFTETLNNHPLFSATKKKKKADKVCVKEKSTSAIEVKVKPKTKIITREDIVKLGEKVITDLIIESVTGNDLNALYAKANYILYDFGLKAGEFVITNGEFSSEEEFKIIFDIKYELIIKDSMKRLNQKEINNRILKELQKSGKTERDINKGYIGKVVSYLTDDETYRVITEKIYDTLAERHPELFKGESEEEETYEGSSSDEEVVAEIVKEDPFLKPCKCDLLSQIEIPTDEEEDIMKNIVDVFDKATDKFIENYDVSKTVQDTFERVKEKVCVHEKEVVAPEETAVPTDKGDITETIADIFDKAAEKAKEENISFSEYSQDIARQINQAASEKVCAPKEKEPVDKDNTPIGSSSISITDTRDQVVEKLAELLENDLAFDQFDSDGRMGSNMHSIILSAVSTIAADVIKCNPGMNWNDIQDFAKSRLCKLIDSIAYVIGDDFAIAQLVNGLDMYNHDHGKRLDKWSRKVRGQLRLQKDQIRKSINNIIITDSDIQRVYMGEGEATPNNENTSSNIVADSLESNAIPQPAPVKPGISFDNLVIKEEPKKVGMNFRKNNDGSYTIAPEPVEVPRTQWFDNNKVISKFRGLDVIQNNIRIHRGWDVEMFQMNNNPFVICILYINGKQTDKQFMVDPNGEYLNDLPKIVLLGSGYIDESPAIHMGDNKNLLRFLKGEPLEQTRGHVITPEQRMIARYVVNYGTKIVPYEFRKDFEYILIERIIPHIQNHVHPQCGPATFAITSFKDLYHWEMMCTPNVPHRFGEKESLCNMLITLRAKGVNENGTINLDIIL